MNALAELRKRAGNPANAANAANQSDKRGHDSQDSQGVNVKTGKSATSSDAMKTDRARLLALAVAEWTDPAHIHRMPDADLADWLGLDDGQRVTFLHLLADTADRHAGRVPEADPAAMHCHHCGPLWVRPSIATACLR